MNKNIRTLSIGNSFSQDACAYIHSQAQSMGINFETVNLYIGGCSLEMHSQNYTNDSRNYLLEINGCSTEKYISIKDALTSGEYDVITLQQASHFSGMSETYYPYITQLADAVRAYQPNAKIMVHQTWAYETDSSHGAFPNYDKNQKLMYKKLTECYKDAAEAISAELIPSGSAVQYFRENTKTFDYQNGGMSLNRDGFHLSIPYGRYLAGLVWIHSITKQVYGTASDITQCTFVPDTIAAEPGNKNSETCGSAVCNNCIFDEIKSGLAKYFSDSKF